MSTLQPTTLRSHYPPLETRRTTESVRHPVNQGLIVQAPSHFYDSEPKQHGIEGVTSNLTDTIHNGHVYGDKQFAITAYKYIVPIILGFCLLTIIVFATILSKRIRRGSSMSRASCLLLLYIACADGLTLIFALSEISYLYSQALGNEMILPFSSCNTMLILERLSAVPHAASTWFTVILTVHRYVCVAIPFKAGNYVNIKESTICVLLVSAFSTGLHACRFFDTTIIPVNIESHNMPGNYIETCRINYASWIYDAVLYESMFAWIRIVTTQLLPCCLIVVFVILMSKSLMDVNIASKHSHLTITKQQLERRRLNTFVVIVSSTVVCVELSNAVFLSFKAWELSVGASVFPHKNLQAASIAFDLVLYLSYFLIFIVYCTMSATFRKTFTTFCHFNYRIKTNVPDMKFNKTVTSSPDNTKKTDESFSL